MLDPNPFGHCWGEVLEKILLGENYCNPQKLIYIRGISQNNTFYHAWCLKKRKETDKRGSISRRVRAKSKCPIQNLNKNTLILQGLDSLVFDIILKLFWVSQSVNFNLVTINGNGTLMKTPNFKFVNPHSKTKILEFNGARRFPVKADFIGKTLLTNAVRTPRVGFMNI